MLVSGNIYSRVIMKAISLLMVMFILNLYVARDAWAAIGDSPSPVKSRDYGSVVDTCQLDAETFNIPYHLGQLRDSHAGDSEFFVIHIQDAHCNRFAQRKVAEIIAYLKSEYGVKTINLEGGEGEYDLDIFRSVPEVPVRKKVAEHFLEIGELNGAEYYAVTDPGEARLWGVEDRELYMRNLRVYRDSLEYRDRAAGCLEYLRNALNGMKADMYNPRLLELDMAYNAYKSGNMEFREYITFLIQRADESGPPLERYENLRVLALSIRLESEVDFDAASAERDRLMNSLKDILSRNESRELVSKAAGYRTKRIPRHEFYGYLMEKAAQAGLREKAYPALSVYVDYIKAFGSVRRDRISSELRSLESDLRKPLFTNAAQRRLDRLSRDLVLLRNFFNISITRADYRYFLENKSDMDVSRYTDFIEEYPGAGGAAADIPADIELLDGYRDRIARFFEYSFSRDKAFLDNMRFAGMPDGRGAAVLVTGGFHTENLCEMFREEGISYVSMIPRFTMAPGYECPYFDLLAGRVSGSRRMLSSILGGNAALQVASLFTPLGEGFWGAGYVRAAKISVVIDGMVTGGKRVSITDGSGRVLEVNGRKLVFGEGEEVHIRLSELMKRAGVAQAVPDAVERPVAREEKGAPGIGRGTTEWLKRYTRGLPLWFRDLIVAPLVEEGVYRGVALGFVSAAALLLTGGMDWRLVAVSMAVLQWTAGGLFISDHSPGEDTSAYFSKSFLIPSLIAVINAVILPFLVSGPGQFMLTAVLVHAMANSIGIMADELTGTAGREKAGGREDEDIPGVESAPLTEVDMEALRDSSVPAGIQLRQEKWRAVFPLRKAVHNHLMARKEDFRGAAMTIPRIISGTGEPGGSDLRIEEPLGRGGFGLVFKATGVKGPMKNREAAVKVLHPDASDASKLSFMREYMFMRALSGAEGVIDTYGAGRYEINGKTYYYIVSEYAADGDLHEEIGRRKRALQRGRRDEVFTLDETMDIGRQLLEALRVIHERDIIHSDIKPSNVFIFRQDDGSVKVKIGDLGIAHYAPDGRIDLLGRAAGTLPYLPAEALRTQIYTGKVDLYALGCLLYQMRHFGKLPYGTRDADRSELNKILSEKGTGAWTARRQELLAEELGVIVDSADHPFELLIAELLLGGDYGGITDAGTALRMLKNDMRRGISSSDDYLRRNELAKNTTRMGTDTTGEPREKADHAKRTPERAGTRPRRPAEPPYAGALRGAGIRIGGVDPVGLEAPDTGQIGSISAGSWFRAKSWAANAWLAESVISLGVGAAVFLSGFVTLAPLAAMFAFWMPHLFFDNKGAARTLPVIALTGATLGVGFLVLANPLGLLAIPVLMFMHWAINRTALEAMPGIIEARAYSIEEKDAVLAAGKYRKPTHQKVHDSIEEGLPDDLKGFADKTPEEQKQLKNKYRDPDGQIVIPIDQLAWNAGLLGHIGLGQYYGEPVIYIHHGLNRTGLEKERAKVKAHELYEIRKWEEKRKELGLDNKGMREWIRANSNERGNGPAQLLAKKWHSEAPEVDSVYRHENIIRAFQNGRLERAYERIRGAIIANMDEWRAVTGEVVGEPLEFIDKYFMEVLTRNSFVAGILPDGKVTFIAAFAEALNDDELAWVLAHEMVHGQKVFQLEREQDVLMGRAAAAVSGIQAEFAKWAGIKAPESVSLSDAIESAKHVLPDVVEGIEEKSQEEEFQADELGVFLIARAGFDPRAGVSAAEKLRMLLDDMHDRGLVEADPTIPRLDDHPDDHLRAEANRKSAEKYTSESTEAIYAEEADVVLAAGTATLPGAGMRQFREYIDSFDVKNLREILYSEGKHIAKQYGFAPGFIPIYDELRALVRARFDMSNLTPKDVIRIARGLMTDEEDDYRLVGHGDTHGELEGFLENLRNAGLIDENGDWIGGNAVLVQMGDLIDRGPKSRECVDFLIKLQQQARDAGGDVVILLGNHELFLLQDIPREFIQTLVRQEGLTPEAAKTEAEKMKKKIEKYIANGNIVASHYAKGRVFVHGGFRSKIREGIKDEVALARGVSRDEVTSGQMVERMNAILRDTAAEKDVPDFVKYEHPIFGVDKARKGTAEVAGIFWADYRDLQKSTMAGEVPQIVAHSPEKRPGAGIRAGMSVRRIDIDAGLFEGYGGNRAYLVMEKGAIKAVEKVGDEYKERVLGSYGVVSATGEEPEAEGPYFDMDMQKTQMFDASKYITMAAARRYTPRPNIVALKSGPEFDKHLEETARYLLDKFPEYLRDYSQLQDDRVANEVMQNIVLDMEITDRTFIKRVLIRAIEIAGRRSPLSAGSWFKAKSWVANAWLAESVISLGVGAVVFLSGFVTLAPLAAMFAFWMPHLFFDNKGAARSMPVIGLAGATYGAMFLAMASPWGLLAIPALILAHRAVNRKALEKNRAEEEAQRQGRIFDSFRAGFPDERIAEMIEFGSGNDYYLGVTLYNNGDEARRERVRELLSEEGIRLLELQELVKEHAEEYRDMFRGPYERRTGDEREQALRDRVLDIGRKNDVMAYGIELAKGGVNTLLHIILGGRIRSGEGSDNWGRMDDATYPEISGGFHGPYWVTFAEPAGDEWMDPENHVHYIVRNEREKDYILSALALAAERGLIKAEYVESAKAKVVTYEEFIAGSGRKGFGERFSRTGDGSEAGPGTEDGRREDKPDRGRGERDREAAGAGAGRTIFDLLMFEHVNGLEERVKASEARLRVLEGLDSTPPVMLENEKQIAEEARERVRSVKELIREVNSVMSTDDPLSMVKALRSIPGMVAPDAGDYGESVLSGLERLSGTQEWIQVDRDTTLVIPEGSPLEDVFLGREAAGSFIPFSYGGRDSGFIAVREKALRKPYTALQVIVHETVHRSLDRKSYRSEMDGSERLAFRALDEAYTETMNAGAMLGVLKREPELRKRIFEGMEFDGVAAILTEADPETQFNVLARKILGENNTYKMERGLLGAVQEEGGIDAVMEFLEKGDASGLERRYGSLWEDVKAVASIDPEGRAQSPGFNAGMIMLSDSMGNPEMSGIARTIAEVLAGEEFEEMIMEWEGEFRTAEDLDPDPDEDIIIGLLQVKAAVRLFEEYKGGGFDRDAVPVDLIAKVEELAPAEFGLAGDAGGKRVIAGLSPDQNLGLVRELLFRHRVGTRVHAAKEAMGDLRRGVADWVITPMAPMSSAAKMSIDKGAGRFIGREYGSETFVRGYGYEESLSDETLSENIRAGFEKVLEEIRRPEFADKMPRVIMYVPADKYALARKALDEVLGGAGLESLADRFNIVREEGVPDNGMIDEVMHVALGKSLLNYERFRKGDYGEKARFGKDAEIRLERFLRTLVADPASVDLGEDAALIARILDGAMSLDMAPVDYEEIREWKTAQDEVLRAM